LFERTKYIVPFVEKRGGFFLGEYLISHGLKPAWLVRYQHDFIGILNSSIAQRLQPWYIREFASKRNDFLIK
jgi:hypothetical protein